MHNMPSFFIFGAPKCGTTALSEYLRENPSIFISDPKELNYFNSDQNIKGRVESEEEYLSVFENVDKETVAIGEASPLYLISEDAAFNLKKFRPDAKIIIMLRPTPDFLYSYHSHLVYLGEETHSNFLEAWLAQQNRIKGISKYPSTCSEPKRLNYKRVGMLGDHVKRVMSCFPSKNVKIILLEDIVHDARKVYLETINFIGAIDDGRMDFPIVNANKRHRNNFVARIPAYFPRAAVSSFTNLKSVLGVGDFSLTKTLFKLLEDKRPKKKISPEMRSILIDVFHEDILLLSDCIDRKLDHWLIK